MQLVDAMSQTLKIVDLFSFSNTIFMYIFRNTTLKIETKYIFFLDSIVDFTS